MQQFLDQFAQLATTLRADIKGNPSVSLEFVPEYRVFKLRFTWPKNDDPKVMKYCIHTITEVPSWMSMDVFCDHLSETVNGLLNKSHENNM